MLVCERARVLDHVSSERLTAPRLIDSSAQMLWSKLLLMRSGRGEVAYEHGSEIQRLRYQLLRRGARHSFGRTFREHIECSDLGVERLAGSLPRWKGERTEPVAQHRALYGYDSLSQHREVGRLKVGVVLVTYLLCCTLLVSACGGLSYCGQLRGLARDREVQAYLRTWLPRTFGVIRSGQMTQGLAMAWFQAIDG